MKKDIEKLLIDHQKFHSDFQIDNFIVGRSGDDWAKYKQALREIETRNTSLTNLREQLELSAWQSLYRRVAIWLRPRRIRLIYAARRRRSRAALVADISETERELKRFIELAKALRKHLGELTPERRKHLEAQTWFNKARQMILIDSIVNGGQPSEKTVEFILGLPMDMQNKLLIGYQAGQAPMINNEQQNET